MRIVAVADTHGYEVDLGALPEGDVLVHAGDLCRRGTLQELATVADWLRALPHRHKIVVAGNHDFCFQGQAAAAVAMLGDECIYLRDSGVALEGVRFWGSPWQPRFFDWAFNLDRGPELAEVWARIPNTTDVLITHGPPRGYGDTTWDGRREGCDDLLVAVERVKPALHFFGHIHEDRGVWQRGASTLVNATTSECTLPPMVVDLDPSTGRVTPVLS